MKKLIALLCVMISLTTVGCTLKKSEKTVNEDNVTADVNTDIKDSALEITYETFNEKEMLGEKVFALGVVTDIDIDGVKSEVPNFILVQDAGENVEEYLICCNMSLNEFQDLGLAEGSAVKVYGTLDQVSKGGVIVIKATLIDRGL